MQKRFAAAPIGRVDLRRCIARILPLVLCCVFMVVLSQTAEASDDTSSSNFAAAYGLELADGESKEVDFKFPGFTLSYTVTNTTTMESLSSRMNKMIQNYGQTASYDASLGRIVVTDGDGGNIDLQVFVDGKELIAKAPPQSGGEGSGFAAGIDTLMAGFEYVVLLFGKVWELMLSNPLLTLCLAASLVAVGVRAFRRLKSAAKA